MIMKRKLKILNKQPQNSKEPKTHRWKTAVFDHASADNSEVAGIQ